MSDIFGAIHRAMFDKLFSLDDEGRQAKAKLLREAGLPEELIAELTRPGIQPGMTFGGAKPVDVMNVEIEVLEVGPPSEERFRGGADQAEGKE